MSFIVKRIYDEPAEADGFRVLVDRLWPRGVSKQRARLDLWLKEVAPSGELRTWFAHDPARFAEFTTRYRAELDTNETVDDLRRIGDAHPTVTLLYSAHDVLENQAIVLRDYLGEAV